MGGKKNLGENSKKVAGNAKKAEAAARKQADDDARKAQSEDQEWSKGAKSNAKKEAAEAKKVEAARKKAEKDAILAEEERTLKSASAAKAAKAATGKGKAAAQKPLSRGAPSLSDDEDESAAPLSALNATGIDNALDALSLTTGPGNDKIDRHPERRFKAALAAYEARRLPEIEEENPGLRLNQRKELVRKEFERAPENPFNQASVAFDASRAEIEEVKRKEREKVEGRLTTK